MEPRPVQVDADGTRWWNWLYEYDWDGARFGFAVCARSREEADDRLRRLPLARFVGQQDGAPVPVGSQMAIAVIWARVVVWWRNLRLR